MGLSNAFLVFMKVSTQGLYFITHGVFFLSIAIDILQKLPFLATKNPVMNIGINGYIPKILRYIIFSWALQINKNIFNKGRSQHIQFCNTRLLPSGYSKA